jgi:hypothetical protein
MSILGLKQNMGGSKSLYNLWQKRAVQGQLQACIFITLKIAASACNPTSGSTSL